MKLILHRASCKYYYDLIKKYNPTYINFYDVTENFYKRIGNTYDKIDLFDPIDHNIIKKLHNHIKNELDVYDPPSFPETIEDIENYFDSIPKKNNKIIHYLHNFPKKEY